MDKKQQRNILIGKILQPMIFIINSRRCLWNALPQPGSSSSDDRGSDYQSEGPGFKSPAGPDTCIVSGHMSLL